LISLKKDVYVYPAVLTYEDRGISIIFPDLDGCISQATTTEEAIKNCKEVLSLYLYGLEEDDDEIPVPSTIDNIKLEQDQIPLLIEVYMPLERLAIDNESRKVTVTMPQWLKVLAKSKNINFSQVIESALKEMLNIKR